LKRDAFETALRQATELGVAIIQPVRTDFVVKTDFNAERAQAIIVEAAEQCERLTLPTLLPVMNLKQAVENQGTLYWAAERELAAAWPQVPKSSAAVLVGPEGGFSVAEKNWLKQQPQVHPVSLGHNILRADTAVVAVLSQLLRG
jgi:16S rRNA (uracil1498-N3)-methyltransferase